MIGNVNIMWFYVKDLSIQRCWDGGCDGWGMWGVLGLTPIGY